MRFHYFELLACFTMVACGGKTAGDTPAVDGAVDSAADSPTDSPPSDGAVPPPDYTTCSGPAACVLATKTCCGSCGDTALTDWAAVATTRNDAYHLSVCPTPTPCPKCAWQPHPNYQAFCRGAKCSGIDVRKDEISLCKTDDDCALRYANCCGCGTGFNELIALRKDKMTELDFQLCPSACTADCAGTFPIEARVRCSSGHCAVDGLAL